MNYATKYECRYHKEDVFLPEDHVTDEEKDYIRDILYKEDLEHIFGLNQMDDANPFLLFNKLIPRLYKQVQSSPELCKIMYDAACHHLFSEDEETGLCVLFSFDYLHLTHDCIRSYLEHGTIDKKAFEQLSIKIKSV
jgi:hypothetical protein